MWYIVREVYDVILDERGMHDMRWHEMFLLHFPTQIRFPIEGERDATCNSLRQTRLSNSLELPTRT